MNCLLDTNVVSELARVEPARRVLDWLDRFAQDGAHVSVLTFGEIRKGIEALPTGAKRSRFEAWFETLAPRFHDRVLDVDRSVADAWGSMLARAERTLPTVDSLIAATALVHRLVLVTRNTKDFNIQGLKVLNPWET